MKPVKKRKDIELKKSAFYFYGKSACVNATQLERGKAKAVYLYAGQADRSRMPLIPRLCLFLYSYLTNRCDLSKSHVRSNSR